MSNEKDFYRWRPHPWHGLEVGPQPPALVYAFIEITSFDLVKYEVDKLTGYLRVDRPQRTSSSPPTLYGFIPRTYCAERVGALSDYAEHGDGDPLDICVFSERPINRAEVILQARVIGGIHMIDHHEADDKIIAVLENDTIWGLARDLDDVPSVLVDRLRHYFSTYKIMPGQPVETSIEGTYGAARAQEVVLAAMEDYQAHFSNPDQQGDLQHGR